MVRLSHSRLGVFMRRSFCIGLLILLFAGCAQTRRSSSESITNVGVGGGTASVVNTQQIQERAWQGPWLAGPQRLEP